MSAASYEAKKLGITRGVPLWEVKKICPEAIILPSDYETYSLISKRMFAILRRYTSLVEEYSIDEAFADITGLRRPLKSSYEEIARRIKNDIESELGISVSAGVSLSKVLAKIGSKYDKPSGLVMIPGRKIHQYLKETPVEKVWGIGPNTTAFLNQLKIYTALDFAQKPFSYIKSIVTKPHQEIWQELNGVFVYPIITEEKDDYISISKTKTFTPPSSEKEFVYAQLIKNLENACLKARRHQLIAKEVIIFLKTQQFRSQGLSIKLNRPSAVPNEMTPLVRELFEDVFRQNTLYRATGVVLCDLQTNAAIQRSLFEPPLKLEKLTRLYEFVDQANAKYGKATVHLMSSHAARVTEQFEGERGHLPARQQDLLKGENRRQRIGIPVARIRV